MPIQSDRVLEIAVILHAHYYKSKGGAVVRSLTSHQCGWVQIPKLTPYVGLEFVVGCLPCSKRFFSGHSSFPSTQKPTFPNNSKLTLPYSLVDATWIVGPGNLPVLRTGINGT